MFRVSKVTDKMKRLNFKDTYYQGLNVNLP